MAKKKAAAPEATPEATAAPEATGTNKSEAIRQVLTENPSMSAKEVAAEVSKRGIEVQEGLVYQVKRTMAGKTGGSKKPRKQTTTAAPAKQGTVADAIAEVKALADKIGIDSLKVIANGLQ